MWQAPVEFNCSSACTLESIHQDTTFMLHGAASYCVTSRTNQFRLILKVICLVYEPNFNRQPQYTPNGCFIIEGFKHYNPIAIPCKIQVCHALSERRSLENQTVAFLVWILKCLVCHQTPDQVSNYTIAQL